jgi:hypothetical protein
MYQVLTKKIDEEVYRDNFEKKEKFSEEKEIKIIPSKNEIEKKLLENNEQEKNVKKNFCYNIELKVANDENFRPIIPKRFFKKKKYKDFINLMKKCWIHKPNERPTFDHITLTIQEIFENTN